MNKKLISLLALALVSITQLYGYDAQVNEEVLFKKHKEHKEHKQKCCEKKCFKHNIQLQLSDFEGFPIEGTEFWVTVDVIKDGSQVTLEFPTINFQTGPLSDVGYSYYFYYYFGLAGGYIYTAEGFLPEDCRPTDLVHQSIVGASNNGLSLPWDFTQLTDLPTPPAGYIVQVTSAGALVIQCAGTFGNVIPDGPQILMPCSITYKVKPRKKLCENFIVTDGFTNTTQFTIGANNGFRDSHVNAAYNNVLAWSWADNSMETDQANNIMNAMVAMGKVDKHGKVRVNAPVQLTNFPDNVQAWDTAVIINPTDPNNIVVSYGLLDYSNRPIAPFYPCRAISTDGGKTWPAPYEYVSFMGSITGNTLQVDTVFNGTITVGQSLVTVYADPTANGIIPYTTILSQISGTPGGMGTYMVNQSPQNVASVLMAASDPYNGPIPICTSYSTGFADNRGVSADKYGNIWYLSTNFSSIVDDNPAFTDQPLFAVSYDKGITFNTVYTASLPPVHVSYSYPQYCFGGTGDGNPENNYGLHFVTDNIFHETNNYHPIVGFIPIMGIGLIGTGTQVDLTSFSNNQQIAGITASSDGRVWTQGFSEAPAFVESYIATVNVLFKSPGALDVNYAGPWNTLFCNFSSNGNISAQDSQPSFGYLLQSMQSIIYDDNRQVLYAMAAFNTPDYSQNMRIVFLISRDNGQTWSDPIDISTTDFANRGFQSMALDPITGDLIFGWYDGRNDPTFTSVQYFGARITAKQLDKMVCEIPLSNPLYELPPATGTPTKATARDSAMQSQQDNKFNGFMQRRLERKRPHFAHIKDKIEHIKQKKAK